MEPERGLRVIHFADVHLGVENYGRLDPSTGLSTRLADFLAAMDQIIDAAQQEHVDLVLAGDAYRTRDPSRLTSVSSPDGSVGFPWPVCLPSWSQATTTCPTPWAGAHPGDLWHSGRGEHSCGPQP